MPTYDYQCSKCGHTFEKFQSIMAGPLRKCPKCGKNALKRLIGIGAGLIFKGSGFYITDYRSESYKDAAKADSAKPAETKSTDAKPSDSKPSEAKPAETKAASPEPAPVKAEAPKSEPAPKSASKSAAKRKR